MGLFSRSKSSSSTTTSATDVSTNIGGDGDLLDNSVRLAGLTLGQGAALTVESLDSDLAAAAITAAAETAKTAGANANELIRLQTANTALTESTRLGNQQIAADAIAAAQRNAERTLEAGGANIAERLTGLQGGRAWLALAGGLSGLLLLFAWLRRRAA